jgi:hypothetical protein
LGLLGSRNSPASASQVAGTAGAYLALIPYFLIGRNSGFSAECHQEVKPRAKQIFKRNSHLFLLVFPKCMKHPF